MSVDALRKVVNKLDGRIEERNLGNPFFSHPDYVPSPFDVGNCRPIEVVDSDRRFAFVDGGNQELVGAPNFSVQINRVYFCVFDSDKRLLPRSMPNKIEFISATSSVFRDGEIHFDTFLFPISPEFEDYLPDEEDLSFSSTDPSFVFGRMRADISRVASIGRRFAEWSFSRSVVEEELDEGDVLVCDGALRAAFTNESRYLNECFDSAERSGVVFSGLSKSSRLFTDTGLSLLGALRSLIEGSDLSYDLWFYHPVVRISSPDHRAALFIVKLHPRAEHVFRYEIYREQAEALSGDDLNEVLSGLSENSKDISLPGYPYGLVDADYYARVRNSELERYRMILLSELSRQGKWDKFERYIHATDTHQILNRLSGVE